MSLKFWKEQKEEYNDLRDKETQTLSVYKVLSDGATPVFEYYVLTVLSCIIATIGLILGSTATIIGAMIVAPLMTPILAFSLGVIRGDLPIIRISLSSIFKGVFWALVISSFLAYIIPITNYSGEILSRTKPSLLDIIVALASGIVGAYGYANQRISNSLIGIAIAVALMPPLCTIGIGIGTLNFLMAGGAGILFLINLISISLAGAIVFWLMKIHPLSTDKKKVRKRAISQIVISIVLLIMISTPVVFYLREGYRISETKNLVRLLLTKEFPEISILELKINDENVGNGKILEMTLTGNEIPDGKDIIRVKNILSSDFPIISKSKIMFVKSNIMTF